MRRVVLVAVAVAVILAGCTAPAATPIVIVVTPAPTEPPTPTPLPATPVPETPTPQPTPTATAVVDRDASAARFATISNAYVDAMNAIRARFADGLVTLKDFHRHWAAVKAALVRFEGNVRSGKYPDDVGADVRILLAKVSTALVAADAVANVQQLSWAADMNERAINAMDAVQAAMHVVGRDLGLTVAY